MTRTLSSCSQAVRAAERAALDTARAHLDAARALYEQGMWPQACFLAMTTIEEIGKALTFQKADADGELPSAEELRELRRHDPKALVGTVVPLVLNDEAR